MKRKPGGGRGLQYNRAGKENCSNCTRTMKQALLQGAQCHLVLHGNRLGQSHLHHGCQADMDKADCILLLVVRGACSKPAVQCGQLRQWCEYLIIPAEYERQAKFKWSLLKLLTCRLRSMGAPCLIVAAANCTQRSKGTRKEVRGVKARMMRRPYSGMLLYSLLRPSSSHCLERPPSLPMISATCRRSEHGSYISTACHVSMLS